MNLGRVRVGTAHGKLLPMQIKIPFFPLCLNSTLNNQELTCDTVLFRVEDS